jgi:hypothetical protein
MNVVKGTRVRINLMTVQPSGFSLAGVQMKFPAKDEVLEGIVRHIWADDAAGTKNVRVQIELADGSLREAPVGTIIAIL